MNKSKFCPHCGHELWLDTLWNGIVTRPIILDNGDDSPTAGEEVMHCPTCGERLNPNELDDEPDNYSL